MTRKQNRYLPIKRSLDIIFSGIILLIALPFLLTIALVTLCAMGRPIFFHQSRPGLNGKIFTILKFRTMKDRYDNAGAVLPDRDRMTFWGSLMRRASVDELPELLNILRGQMSFIGPRPLLVKYLPLYTGEQMRRHEIRPGLTGWAQVNGRNALSWEEKFRMDIWYVDHCSFLLDMRIMLRTAYKIISGEGISQPGEATAEEFTGTGGHNV
jgi:sugar transferase EpsL